jgi:type II secretion system protein L
VRRWLSQLSDAGVEPAALVPLALAIPERDGVAVAFELGGQRVLRKGAIVWADEAGVTDALLDGASIDPLDNHASHAALLRLADNVPINLLTGPFSKKRQFSVDPVAVKRVGFLALALFLVTMAIPVAELARSNLAVGKLKDETRAAAAKVFPDAADPVAALDTALASKRGPGVGLLPIAAAAFEAAGPGSGSELAGMRFAADGTLELTVRSNDQAAAAQFRTRIEGKGFAVGRNAERSEAGKIVQILKVTAS